MCGIAGVWAVGKPGGTRDLAELGAAMADSLRHRGPDGEGVWSDPEQGICLAHRRLCVVDLSPAGAQPMASATGRFIVSYNGEIYNHRELRAELEARGVRFRGRSDTEVVVEAIAAWGVDAAPSRFNGMFALAIWDRRDRALSLVRDPMGIKPLYWGWVAGSFAFASELKAFGKIPGWTGEIDRDALTAYLRYGYVPAPRSIYRDVFKLQAGCTLRIDAAGVVAQRRFWDTRALAATARPSLAAISDAEAIDRLEALLRDAVARCMVADVPVGAFLSGGVDSSMVVAAMQAASSCPVHTFSLGFDQPGHDEAPHAAAVARHLGTDHTELRVTARQAMEVIPDLPLWYDEPFADASQIPTALVAHLARKDVTVALSGDGGDEVFAGYTRYAAARRVWQPLERLPSWLGRAIPRAIGALSPQQWDWAVRPVPARWRPAHFGQRLHKLRTALAADGANDFCRRLLSHWHTPGDVVIGGREPPDLLDDASLAEEFPDLAERMQVIDLLTYLPDDILTKVDRASMAVALEVRVPILDHRVVAFACSLPSGMRQRNGQGKWLLRQVLYRYVPPALVERPKMGFGVPLESWLRGPLRDWAETLIGRQALAEQGFFHPEAVRSLWQDHLSGRRDGQYPLWTILMFQAWRCRLGRP
ncbi:MAG: asparagine synthase (glutamine-hydrolyzing) [Azospirillum sp.]|nr:asparagine synthase (glutamine-hydrolyzing) [Azospirillum sp.]